MAPNISLKADNLQTTQNFKWQPTNHPKFQFTTDKRPEILTDAQNFNLKLINYPKYWLTVYVHVEHEDALFGSVHSNKVLVWNAFYRPY